jgi:hypothetical protein
MVIDALEDSEKTVLEVAREGTIYVDQHCFESQVLKDCRPTIGS